MKNSSHNWLSNCLNPGFLLLVGLELVALSFTIFQANKFSQLIVCLLIFGYLLTLLYFKYKKQLKVFLAILVIFVGYFLLAKKGPDQPNLNQPLIIYPDQVKINDDFLSGQGKIGKQPVSLAFKIRENEANALKDDQILILHNVQADIQEIDGPTTPGQFNFKKYNQGKDIYWQLKIKNYQAMIKKPNFSEQIHILRSKIQNYFAQFPQNVRFLASEMILAQNPTDETKTILENYRDLGVIHLLSISGLHVGLYTIVIAAFCTLLKRTEVETVIICSIFLLIEVLLSDFQPGFVRASLSYILASFFNLKKIPLAAGDRLGLAVLIHLLIKPKLFFSSGAILSYLLVFGLELTNNLSKLRQNIKLNLLINPVLLFSFYRINILTILYNMIIVPVFNYVLLPLTFIAITLGKFLPSIVDMIEKLFLFIMRIIEMIANTKLGMLTFGQLKWWQAIFLLLVTVVSILLPSLKLTKLRLKYWVVVSYLIIFIQIHFPLYGQVTFIDVGQGDSILITTPFKRKAYLIDTGGKVSFGKKKSQPQVNRITLPFLYSQGIDHLDGIFLSHQDADHVGDLGPLLDQIKVKKLYFAKGLTDNPSFRKRIANHTNQIKLVPLLANDQVKEGGLVFNVVYPFQPGLGKNEDSLSLYFEIAHKKWLFTGDLDRNGERKIMEHYGLKVDYFKLGHHGSKTATDPEFMKKLTPELVFISSGRNNRFGHPHPETLQTLQALNIPALNTQDSGTITWTYSKFGPSKFTTFLSRKNK
ncbi:DNA internalization-related competence protein ComEC/Rec2 [Lactobacillus hominis]|uniref:DNA internalization-related competence protein ComEC/Rec2 n=3 Tax=Lactobacillus hominis TaxID=1203033 RepID=UPI00263606EA|nr:DNA internalization-related competence protein ComEC/Rec2 [Lactobacillus hominis]